jgi:hypothetical protein
LSHSTSPYLLILNISVATRGEGFAQDHGRGWQGEGVGGNACSGLAPTSPELVPPPNWFYSSASRAEETVSGRGHHLSPLCSLQALLLEGCFAEQGGISQCGLEIKGQRLKRPSAAVNSLQSVNRRETQHNAGSYSLCPASFITCSCSHLGQPAVCCLSLPL